MCQECNKETINVHHSNFITFISLTDDVARTQNLEQLINNNFKKEKRDKSCADCQVQLQTHESSIRVKKMPDVFIVQIKRYNHSGRATELPTKINATVKMEENLNLNLDTM